MLTRELDDLAVHLDPIAGPNRNTELSDNAPINANTSSGDKLISMAPRCDPGSCQEFI